MEEAIKILKDEIDIMRALIREYETDENYVKEQTEIIQAIENLIKGYRELEEKNKELFKTCCKYEDTLEHYENKIFDELDDYIKLDEISKLDKIRIKGKKYISELKIKDKIEQLEREFDFFAGREHFEWQDGEFDGEVCDDIALKIQVLQELMEDK